MNFSALRSPQRSFIIAGGLVLAWFAFSEIVTEAWYRYKERQFTRTEPWNIQLPNPENPSNAQARGMLNFQSKEIGEQEKEILLFETGYSASWQDSLGNAWNAFVITWPQDEQVGEVDAAHNPTVCLPAVGFEFVENGPLVNIPINGTETEFRSWIFQQNDVPVYVFMAVRKEYDIEDINIVDRKVFFSREGISHRALHRAQIGLRRSGPLQAVQIFVRGPRNLDEASKLAVEQVLGLQG